MDGYFNEDAGTLSPYRHGEVFVLDDGTECDMDIGTYERFVDKSLSEHNIFTNGRLARRINELERSGQFSGSDVQFYPHVTGEVIRFVRESSLAYQVRHHPGGDRRHRRRRGEPALHLGHERARLPGGRAQRVLHQPGVDHRGVAPERAEEQGGSARHPDADADGHQAAHAGVPVRESGGAGGAAQAGAAPAPAGAQCDRPAYPAVGLPGTAAIWRRSASTS